MYSFFSISHVGCSIPTVRASLRAIVSMVIVRGFYFMAKSFPVQALLLTQRRPVG